MKPLILSTLFMVAGFFTDLDTNKQSFGDNPKQLATVEQYKGKYLFVLSEPVQPYEVVENLNTVGTAILGTEKDIKDLVKEMVKRGIRKVENGKIQPFDAIITDNGQRGVLIKFKTD